MSLEPPFERIVFDCDSTLSSMEGIDELAGEHREEVEDLTRQAMDGRLPIEDVYGRRLLIIEPVRNAVATLGRSYIEQAVPGARQVVAALKSLGKEVRIVSAGLKLAVDAFAGWLGVPYDHVHAVKIFFDADGHYRGYDRDDPLTRSGGKKAALASFPPARTVFVGDGATDAEVCELDDTSFVCFAGVVRREDVVARADAVLDGPSMADLMALVCTAKELDLLLRDPRHERLAEHAVRPTPTSVPRSPP